MARTVREASLATRSARLRHAINTKPYWRVIEQGLHLGYRRRETGGTWIARRRDEHGIYREAKHCNNSDSPAVSARCQPLDPTRWLAQWQTPELVERLTAGRSPNDVLLRRHDGLGWKRAEQLRPMRGACARAGIAPAVGFHVLRHTHASILAMRAVPMAVIARQLGHSDTRMTERHYAHLAPNYVADTIRASFPRLTETKSPNVMRIGRHSR
jgi:hypothetical protein